MPKLSLVPQINNITFYQAYQIVWDCFILIHYFNLGNRGIIPVSDQFPECSVFLSPQCKHKYGGFLSTVLYSDEGHTFLGGYVPF